MEKNDIAYTKQEIDDLINERKAIDDKIAIKNQHLNHLLSKQRESIFEKYGKPGVTHFLFSRDQYSHLPLIRAVTLYEIKEEDSWGINLGCLIVTYDTHEKEPTCKSCYYECSKNYFCGLFDEKEADIIRVTNESLADKMLLKMTKTYISAENYKEYINLLKEY